jgi:hypothetical protein
MQHLPYQARTPSFLHTIFGALSYTREEALKRGTLVDVTAQAKRFSYPCAVAISRTLFEQCVQWDRFDSECQVYQDQDNRLSNVLVASRAAMRRSGFAQLQASFVLKVLPKDGYSRIKTSKHLKIMLDKDDQNHPALTLMMVDDLHQALLDFSRNAQENLDRVAL